MAKFDETCSMCGVPIVVSVFRNSTLCAECRSRQAAEEESLLQMPAAVRGTWYEQLPDGFRLGSSIKSWKGMVALGVLAAWPIIARNGVSRDFLTVVLMAGAASVALWECALALFGTVRLTRNGSEFTVFTGIGPIGVRRVYTWGDLTSVHERASGESGSEQEIVLVGARRASFGRRLSDERRYFLREILRIELRRGR